MAAITQKKCFNHHAREAVARCPSCTRFYCRECITEHDSRMICATCLAREQEKDVAETRDWGAIIGRSLQVIGAMLLLYIFFFVIGQILVQQSAAFHSNMIWQTTDVADP